MVLPDTMRPRPSLANGPAGAVGTVMRQRSKGRGRILLVSLLVLALGLLLSQAASPSSFAVPCSGAGGGADGLIAAMNAANADPAADTITLAAGCTYTLTVVDNGGTDGPNGLPVVATPITIDGNGSTIARGSLDAFRILEVASSGQLDLVHLRVTGGHAGDGVLGASDSKGGDGFGGGGILNAGVLTLRNSAVTDNSAGNGSSGQQ
jgi:hypothetical protein